jgi:hypothetical protein
MKHKLVLEEEYEIEQDFLEEVTREFLRQPAQHPEVKKSVERFQLLWENIGGGESLIGQRPALLMCSGNQSKRKISLEI